MEGSLRTASERPTAGPSASHGRSNLCCAASSSSSSAEEAPSHGRSRPSSARGFLGGKFPGLLRRKRGSPVPPGQAACRSRLCVEATHESPIQAVRKPAAGGEALGWDPDEDSLGGRSGPSLLRKLLCLRATSSQLHKPPGGQRPWPLHRACARCGPVAALGRTADPQGESPLRWKAAEARPVAEPQRRAAVAGLAGSCVAKPWRVFRSMLASRAKKGALPVRQREQDPHPPGAAREGNLGLAAEPESSPASGASEGLGGPQSCTAAVEDTHPPAAFPPGEGEPSGEAGGHRIPPQGLESCGSPSEESRHQKATLAQGGPQTQVGDLWGGSAEEDATEGSGGGGYWGEVGDGEEEDLADLAENPGGQGMVMATGDLGWLSSELLGGPGRRLGGQKREASTDSQPEAAPGLPGEDALWAERAHTQAAVLGPATAQADGAPVGQPRGVGTAAPPPTSRAHTLGDAGAPCPGFLQDADPARCLEPPWALPLPARGPPSPPHGLLVPVDPAGENRLGQGSAPPRPASAGSEEEQKKQLLYRAAVEIVGAAVDAAAAQVAKKEEQERAQS